MAETMIETDLTINDFTKYFEQKKLGKLYLPNGKAFNTNMHDWTKFNINLGDLYKLMSGWKINHTEVPLNDILAVISFGSAVKYPGYTEKPIEKGYFRKRTIMKRAYINPADADFFVLTKNDITRDEYIKPGTTTLDYGSGGCITAITKGGINLVNRGVNQLFKGIENGDTISISAIKEGILVFCNREELEKIINKTGIKKETPRKLLWDETNHGNLIGKIE
jgi:hypothetical protein